MSAKSKANTSKTAHVMNLLSKNREPAAQEEPGKETLAPEISGGEEKETAAAEAPVEEGVKEEKSRRTGLPPMLASLAPDAAVSAQIKTALEATLEEELAALAQKEKEAAEAAARKISSATREEPAAPAPPKPVASGEAESPQAPQQPLPRLEEEEKRLAEALAAEMAGLMEEETVQDSKTGPEEEAEKETAVQEAPSRDAAPKAEGEKEPETSPVVCVNVMERLVEGKLGHYVKMFGLCSCHQCVLDVKALTLNSLVPHYVTMDEKELSFRMDLYETRFQSTVTAQILLACQAVMERPRHRPPCPET